MRSFLPPFCLAALVSTWLIACGGDESVLGPGPKDEGTWILDYERTIDEFPFSEEACRETFPEGSANSDSVPPGSAASVRIVSTACYLVRVHVEDGEGDTVRSFASRFGIFHRTDEEKNRGVVGFVSWDGRDADGIRVPDGRYLWRMEFDFGSGRLRKFRADVMLP